MTCVWAVSLLCLLLMYMGVANIWSTMWWLLMSVHHTVATMYLYVKMWDHADVFYSHLAHLHCIVSTMCTAVQVRMWPVLTKRANSLSTFPALRAYNFLTGRSLALLLFYTIKHHIPYCLWKFQGETCCYFKVTGRPQQSCMCNCLYNMWPSLTKKGL